MHDAEHAVGAWRRVDEVSEAELHRREWALCDGVERDVRLRDVEREVVGECPARGIELYVRTDMREERGREENAGKHVRRVAGCDRRRVADEPVREPNALQHLAAIRDDHPCIDVLRQCMQRHERRAERPGAVRELERVRRRSPPVGECASAPRGE